MRKADMKGFAYPMIDYSKCAFCGKKMDALPKCAHCVEKDRVKFPERFEPTNNRMVKAILEFSKEHVASAWSIDCTTNIGQAILELHEIANRIGDGKRLYTKEKDGEDSEYTWKRCTNHECDLAWVWLPSKPDEFKCDICQSVLQVSRKCRDYKEECAGKLDGFVPPDLADYVRDDTANILLQQTDWFLSGLGGTAEQGAPSCWVGETYLMQVRSVLRGLLGIKEDIPEFKPEDL